MQKSLAAALLCVALLVPAQALSEIQDITRLSQGWIEEERLYSLDFLFFKHLGEGRLRFESTDQTDVFRAELVGRALGFAAWLSGHRTQTYTSTMQLMPDGSLNSIEHTFRVQKKKTDEWEDYRRNYYFNCSAVKILEEKIINSRVVSSEEHDISGKDCPVDILTAFYNLRVGFYGNLERGRTFSIPTFSTQGFSEIKVKVLTINEHRMKKYFPGTGLLIQAVVPTGIFGTRDGHMYLWFDNHGVPSRGIIEDMIGFGDIKGYLMEE